MEEEIAIIDSNTRNEKIKNFFLKNKKIIIIFLTLILFIILSFFSFNEYKSSKKNKISDKYNSAIIEYSEKNKENTKETLIELIQMKDSTYSPLSLFFIIDKKLISDQARVNELFDVIIKKTSLEKEIKNLIIYKKALFNADNIKENDLLSILNPIINSESVWKSHALYLIGEYFFAKDEKQKSKEFFNEILVIENANQDLKIEAQKRLSRDLSD